MNREELKEILSVIAARDLSDGYDIYDHPCTVAIRAIDQCFDDIDTLKGIVKRSSSNYSKKIQVLVKSSYKPSW